MRREDCIETETMATKTTDGRDELNLAEFPLCALSHRLRPEQKTFLFQDQIRDDFRGVMITRRLTITGSHAYGLPRALDEEGAAGLNPAFQAAGVRRPQGPFHALPANSAAGVA